MNKCKKEIKKESFRNSILFSRWCAILYRPSNPQGLKLWSKFRLISRRSYILLNAACVVVEHRVRGLLWLRYVNATAPNTAAPSTPHPAVKTAALLPVSELDAPLAVALGLPLADAEDEPEEPEPL
jgi:hypothetical protein